MAKKKSKSRSLIEPDLLTEDADTRPESSPYTSPSVELYFGDSPAFKVPSSLLHGYPKLCSYDVWGTPHTEQLKDITPDVGHVIVHHLFTHTYQCLKPQEESPHERLVTEFRTSVLVYAASRSYKIPSLQELARVEIEKLGEDLPLPLILDLVRSAYPNPSTDDTWFSGYLRSRLETSVETPERILDCAFLQVSLETMSISDMVLRNLLELLIERKDLSLEEPAATIPLPQVHEPEYQTEQEYDIQPKVENGWQSFAEENGEQEVIEEESLPQRPPEPEPEFEPIPEPEQEPVTEEKQDDDVWGSINSKKKKKKKSIFFSEPCVEDEPLPEPVQEPVTEEKQDDDVWGSINSKKKKKKSIFFSEPCAEDEPELIQDPDPVPDEKVNDDIWGFSASKKDKKRKGKKSAIIEEPVAYYEP